MNRSPAHRLGRPAPTLGRDGETHQQAQALAALLDAAADDLRANGPVPAAELAEMLAGLEQEWAALEAGDDSPRGAGNEP